MPIIRKLLRADGTSMELPAGKGVEWLRNLIGADILDTVRLHLLGDPLHVMLLDDLGHPKRLPINPEATRLYLRHCVPGTQHCIRGDVVIVPDDDFAEVPA